MKRVVKTMGILMLTFFLAAPCFARKVHLIPGRSIYSLPIYLPVEADIDDDSRMLTIQFLKEMGNVTIEVRNTTGNVVSYDSVEAIALSSISISLTEEEAGTYQVFVIVKDGSGYYGNFELF